MLLQEQLAPQRLVQQTTPPTMQLMPPVNSLRQTGMLLRRTWRGQQQTGGVPKQACSAIARYCDLGLQLSDASFWH
jgi:hypothetical protein